MLLGYCSLTDGLGNGHDLGTVEGQVSEGPDDRVHLLHDVEGDGHDAASVLTHGHAPVKHTHTFLRTFKLN